MEKKQLPLDELTKIAADDYAAYAFAARLEQEGLMEAPKNLKESIHLQRGRTVHSKRQKTLSDCNKTV